MLSQSRRTFLFACSRPLARRSRWAPNRCSAYAALRPRSPYVRRFSPELCAQAPEVATSDSTAESKSIIPDYALFEDDTTASSESTVSNSRRSRSLETRRKISSTMLGVPKSDEMRAKLSASMKLSMKKRAPWNKGKTLSEETKRRMSESRRGRTSWNKGIAMSEAHKRAISQARLSSSSRVSEKTRRLLQLARRRPGDGIVMGGVARTSAADSEGFPLIDTADIHAYVTLRRSLRGWSDSFAERNGRRPTLADVRRTGKPSVIRDFEKYVAMRGAIRGLAADVCGEVNPADVPVIRPQDASATSPRNNNFRRLRYTRYGNRRLASDAEAASAMGGQGAISCAEDSSDAAALAALGVSSTRNDMWDAYDAPTVRPSRASGFGVDHTLFGAHELSSLSGTDVRESLSVKDYRTIGKYRLMESKDICAFVQLRRELERWTTKFRATAGRTPRLSDVKDRANPGLYAKFCKYLDMRHSMSGLMREVYGTSIDDLQSTYDRVSEEAQSVLDVLREGTTKPKQEHD